MNNEESGFQAERMELATRVVRAAGRLAGAYFADLSNLRVSRKGHQDFVSAADFAVEQFMREQLLSEFPDDSIVGEEQQNIHGTSGFTWVIDPIDGTSNFVNNIPAWAVVLAGVENGRVVSGYIYDFCHDELYIAEKGEGATLNGTRLWMDVNADLHNGSIGYGFSNRRQYRGTVRFIELLLEQGGVFTRNGSGALSLAHVAAGRSIGYVEEHMNAWDCLAGQLLVLEAGGAIELQNVSDMIEIGGRVIASTRANFESLTKMADKSFDLDAKL